MIHAFYSVVTAQSNMAKKSICGIRIGQLTQKLHGVVIIVVVDIHLVVADGRRETAERVQGLLRQHGGQQLPMMPLLLHQSFAAFGRRLETERVGGGMEDNHL